MFGIFEGVFKIEVVLDGEFELSDRFYFLIYNLLVMVNDELIFG